jgi:hypothetical protein
VAQCGGGEARLSQRLVRSFEGLYGGGRAEDEERLYGVELVVVADIEGAEHLAVMAVAVMAVKHHALRSNYPAAAATAAAAAAAAATNLKSH